PDMPPLTACRPPTACPPWHIRQGGGRIASEIGWTRRISYASCLVSETAVRLARALLRKVVGKPVVSDHSKTTESGESRNSCRGVDFRYPTLPEACKCRTCSHHGHGCRQCQSDPYTHVLSSSIYAELRSRAEAALKKVYSPNNASTWYGG